MKNDLLFYRGYVATVWLDVKSGVLRGRVEGMNADLAFETADAGAVEALFHDVVDEYLAHCEEWGRRPARQYHGVFSVRMDAALHALGEGAWDVAECGVGACGGRAFERSDGDGLRSVSFFVL